MEDMKIEPEYLDKLLMPLANNTILPTADYVAELEQSGLILEDETGRIERKFEVGLQLLGQRGQSRNLVISSKLRYYGTAPFPTPFF